MPGELSLCGSQQQFAEVAVEQRHQHLAFGIAEADIIFDEARA